MIVPAQIPNPYVKPRWQAPVGVMESVVAYNCRKHGFPLPVLAMPFWEGAGNLAIDFSGYANHGSLVGQPKWVSDGLDLNGSSDYINLGNTTSLNPDYISISARVKTSATGDYDQIITKDDVSPANRVWQFRKTNAEKLNFIVFKTNSDLDQITGSTTLSDGVFHNIIGTWDGAHIKAYVDGKSDATPVAYSGSLQQGQANDVFIGRSETIDSGFFDGVITNPLIFNIALTSAQVKFLHENPYFMYQIPEEMYGYSPAVVGAIMNQFQKSNIGADLYNGAIIA